VRFPHAPVAVSAATLAFITALAAHPDSAGAHGGGLNAKGCHTNRKTGDYHCHRSPSPRPARQPESPAPPVRAGRQCGQKIYCTQMTSCAEAIFFFTECGLGRLDGDGDGVPCEALCR
jgi:hypothetical protein